MLWPTPNICSTFGIKYPIVQAGMVWVSGAKLAAAAAEAGCLGLVGAGSMKPDVLRTQLQKVKRLTQKPVGVNLPLLYRDVELQLAVSLEEGIRIFFTSAGSPKKFTAQLKTQGCIVVHVTSSIELALKCQDAGVDAVVLEGFEAGGHNGRDELTTFVLLQQLRKSGLTIPVIAAGGIGSGAGILAAFALGAHGVQIGTLFAATQESSAHGNFKTAMTDAPRNATFLRMRKTVPVRLMHNAFSQRIAAAEDAGATPEELNVLLGAGRARKGMSDGDLEEGELEVGQIVSEVEGVPTCGELVGELVDQYRQAAARLGARY